MHRKYWIVQTFLVIYYTEISCNYNVDLPYITGAESFDFSTCNSFGKHGPSQELCDSVYKKTNVRVKVIDEGIYKGVQVWTVPENSTYFIHASGAGGGEGAKTAKRSRGAMIEGKFTFYKGEEIYLLVGQQGTKACYGQMSVKVLEICRKGHSKKPGAMKIGGAGGGGGATYVFKLDKVTKVPTLLLVAGGGGGLPYDQSHENFSSNFHPLLDTGVGVNGHTNPQGAGGGGGLNGSTEGLVQAGKSLLEGGEGGDSCREVQDKLNWNTPGGFGGGGGACSSGGGGGGYSGGDAALNDSIFHGGKGGTSYAHPDAVDPKIFTGEKNDGFVEIDLWLPGCKCEEICEIDDWITKSYHCECLHGNQLRSDGITCEVVVEVTVSSNTSLNDSISTELSLGFHHLNLEYIIVIALACTVLTLSVVAVFICIAKRRQHAKNLKAVRLELITASQSFTIRPPHVNGNVTDRPLSNTRRNAEYNPNYDFGNMKQPDQQLKELNRNNLKLARALGQGAFGEVYKGYLSSLPNTRGQAVAVKTLSAFSTQESELDFLMEAVILSKFHHPNIVNLIGVCFESHPRYIVLELLEGGDLKTFLREMRPKPDMSPPLVTVLDLLMLAIDISRGCQHLEDRHFIHRDIAARNCLLTCKGASRQAKIADFGMARDVYRSDYYKKGGKAMLPIKWMPPEAFLDGVFTSKTDVWSFGILLWEIFSMGYMPYPGRTNHDVMQYVTSGGRLEPPDKCPQSIMQLMSICWAAIPETRPNFTEVLQYLQGVSTNPDITRGELPNFVMIPSFGKEKSDSSISDKIPTSVTIETTLSEPIIDFDDNKLSDQEEEMKEPLLGLSETQKPSSMNSSNKAANKNDNTIFPSLVVQLPEEQCNRRGERKNVCDTFNNVSKRGSVDTMVQTMSGMHDMKSPRENHSRIANSLGGCSINEHSPLLTSDKLDNCENEKEANTRNSRLDGTGIDRDKKFFTKALRSSLRESENNSPHNSVKRMKSSNI